MTLTHPRIYICLCLLEYTYAYAYTHVSGAVQSWLVLVGFSDLEVRGCWVRVRTEGYGYGYG